MSTFESMFAAMGEPLLADHLGETVTRHPLGDLDPEAALTVEDVPVDRSAEDQGLMLPAAANQVRNDEGQRQYRQWLLSVPASVQVDDQDKWTVAEPDGTTSVWNTLRVLGANAGRREVLIQRPLPVHTRRPRVRD